MSIEINFRVAMRDAGIPTEAPIVGDSELHRVHVEGDRPGTINGWYVLHTGTHPAGAFGCNKRGISDRWRANNSASNAAFSPVHRELIEAQRKARAMEQERGYNAAAERAGKILHAATGDASKHAYITRKNIPTFGVHSNRDDVLVVPIYNARTGLLQSLQFINVDGQKRMLTGGRLSTGCFPLRHTSESFRRAAAVRIGVGEGYATTASLAHVLGDSVAMFSALSASNLIKVATALREHYPNAEITIYSDNDQNEVGQTAAIKAAIAVNGFVAIPPIVGTDWNDALKAAA